MMDAIMNVELQLMQTAAQRRPEEADGGNNQFRDLLEKHCGTSEVDRAQQTPDEQAQTTTATADVPAEPMGDTPELREQMVLAALAMMQNPVVYPQQEMPMVQQDMQQTAQAVELLAPQAEAVTMVKQSDAVMPEMVQQMPVQTQTQTKTGKSLMASVDVEHSVEQTSVQTTVQEQIKPVEHTMDTVKAEIRQSGRETEETLLVDAGAEAPVFQDVREIPFKVGEATGMTETEIETVYSVETQVEEKLTELLQNGETRVEIQLTPENLGRIDVELTWSEDGTLSVELKVESGATRALLEKDTAGLQAMLARTTEREVRVEVQQNQESQQQNFRQDERGGEQREPQQHQQREQERQNSQDFLQQLRLGLIPMDLAAS